VSSFNSLAETRKLGAPVVRLFRVALGRDPDAIELQRYASRLRQGAALHDLATDMTRSIEFRRLMGCDSNADAAFVARIAANALPEGPTREAALVALQAAAELGMNQGDLVGMLSDSPPGRDNIPLFPGLAPGASPEDTTAYRLWIEEYDSPSKLISTRSDRSPARGLPFRLPPATSRWRARYEASRVFGDRPMATGSWYSRIACDPLGQGKR
jgi:hypothetical protein